jgi:hemoglobin-like flavoprotein
MSLDAQILRDSFTMVAERAPDLTDRFYDVLFERYPQARALFVRNSRQTQAEMLARAIAAVLDHVEDAAWLQETLTALGAKHAGYGVSDEMYGWVGECLLATLAAVAGDDWSPTVEKAWSDAYGAISGLMIAGARDRAA